MFVEDGRTVHGIARELNRQGVAYGTSKWSYDTVQQILSHPKYAGCNVFGRTSQKLGTPTVRVPEAEWVRTPKAFRPVVSEEVYAEAQKLLLSRTINKPDRELLDSLRRLLTTHGRLSLQLIKATPETPSPSTYRKRFGSVRRAYELIGYGKPSDFGAIDLRRRTQAIREDLIRGIQAAFPDRVTVVSKGGRWRSFLRLANGRLVTVLIARSVGKSNTPIWQIDPVRRECRRVTLIALFNEDNSAVYETHLVPCISRRRRFNVRQGDLFLANGKRLKTLLEFYDAVRSV